MTHWHHFPAHDFSEAGAFMVTAGTYGRYRYFGSPERLTLLTDSLFGLAEDHGVQLQAWAVMANHYHFVALAPSDPQSVRPMIARLHAVTAKRINDEDESPGRKVWFQYWDSHITFQRSYYARLNYVH